MSELCTYTDGAQFPKYGIVQKGNYKNIDDENKGFLCVYLTYVQNNDFTNAAAYMAEHPVLIDYMYGMADANRQLEEIRNTQIVAMQDKQSVYYQSDKPVTYKVGDIIIMDADVEWED